MDGSDILSALFVASLVSSNFLASKVTAVPVPVIGDVMAPAGIFAIGVAFLWSDLLSELYGPEKARSVVNSAILSLILVLGLGYIAVWLPAAPFYSESAAFESVITSSANITIASISTMLVSQNIDISVFHRIKEMTGGNALWARNIGSTVISQFVDTVIFITLGFVALPMALGGTVTPLVAIPSLIISQYVLKCMVAITDTPIFYAISSWSQ